MSSITVTSLRAKPDYSFGKRNRINQAEDFRLAFDRKVKTGVNPFSAKPTRKYRTSVNWQCWFRKNDLNYPRLGLVVSKRFAKNAVDRNALKRSLREFFRQVKPTMTTDWDVIFRLNARFESGRRKRVAKEAGKLFQSML